MMRRVSTALLLPAAILVLLAADGPAGADAATGGGAGDDADGGSGSGAATSTLSMRSTGTTTKTTTYDDDASRAKAIRAEFAHSWKGYRAHAFGHDELEPVSATHRDNWGGVAMTLVDSLDTLWLMGGGGRGRRPLHSIRFVIRTRSRSRST